MGQGGLILGHPLHEFRGVLTGVPVYEGSTEKLMAKRGSEQIDG
jgi:hypothetical protein